MSEFCPVTFNIVNPVVGITTYENGVVVVKRKSKLTGLPIAPEGRKERKIMTFTAKSMSRLVASVNATQVKFNSMLTLTYPAVYPRGGEEIKKSINSFLTMYRDANYGQYLWFLEFQVRGAPHFHILSEVDCISPRMRIRVTEKWVGMISKSKWFQEECDILAVRTDRCPWEVMSKALKNSYWFTMRRDTWELIRKEKGAVRYATKYATKEYQKTPPSGFDGVGRFWGCSNEVSLGEGDYHEMDEQTLRKHLESTDHATAEWSVLPTFLFAVSQERAKKLNV